MKIISMLTYWGQITNGSVVYIATKRGIREGTVVAMRCVTEWPLLRCDGRFDEHPIVDLDLGADERVLNVPLSELHPNQWAAQDAYVQALVQRTVREELAKTKEIGSD